MAERGPCRHTPDIPGIARAALPQLPTLVRHWLPAGHRQGPEWVALNPLREDSHPGSFKINLNNGRWADFATGDRGGDVVSLVAYLRGVPQSKAARLLVRELECTR